MKGVGHSDRGKNNKTRQRMEVTKQQYAGKIGTNTRQERPGTTNNFRQNDKWPDDERTKTGDKNMTLSSQDKDKEYGLQGHRLGQRNMSHKETIGEATIHKKATQGRGIKEANSTCWR